MLVDAGVMRATGGMDEDFFLYYEEVALCRSARALGYRVEFDDEVSAVHLRPLQNRAVSPKMRVIVRHAKLLFFRKYLARWQFFALREIIATEAAIRGLWSSAWGRAEEAQAWRSVGRLTQMMEQGEFPRGREVLAFAEPGGEVDDRLPRTRFEAPHPLDGAMTADFGGHRTVDAGDRPTRV